MLLEIAKSFIKKFSEATYVSMWEEAKWVIFFHVENLIHINVIIFLFHKVLPICKFQKKVIHFHHGTCIGRKIRKKIV